MKDLKKKHQKNCQHFIWLIKNNEKENLRKKTIFSSFKFVKLKQMSLMKRFKLIRQKFK